MNGWTVIVPVKPWRLAKTRLLLDQEQTRLLARAFALDTVETTTRTSGVGAVVVVSAELEVGMWARRHGAAVLQDRPMLHADPLNQAVRLGGFWAQANRPGSPVVVVPADLASLTPSTLSDALDRLQPHVTAFVPDAAGVGTTLVAAHCPQAVCSAYGHGSALTHLSLGLTPVAEVDARVRQDVDTTADLAAARHLGLGRHARAAWGAVRAEPPTRPGRWKAVPQLTTIVTIGQEGS